MTPSEYAQRLEAYLDGLLEDVPVAEEGELDEMLRVREKFQRLQAYHRELQRYAVQLSIGNIDCDPPARGNFLAAGLKQLQAQLRHLEWQARRVAEGDYKQRIDFMGDFSASFNNMVCQLEQRETRLREQQAAMIGIFDRFEPIFVVAEDDDQSVLYANKLASDLLHLQVGSPPPASETLDQILSTLCDDDGQQIEDLPSGKWFHVSRWPLQWGENPRAQLFYCHDITAQKAREMNLDHAANTDGLTGISNRRAFEHALTQLWGVCRDAQKPLSALMFDIDHFKMFNDTYGHPEGDKALIYFANVLKHRIGRANDIVARYGGEEFIVLLPMTDETGAMALAESVRRQTEDGVVLVKAPDQSDREVRITVSCGVSSVTPMPEGDPSPSRLIAAADAALYRAKQQGRNRTCCQAVGPIGE